MPCLGARNAGRMQELVSTQLDTAPLSFIFFLLLSQFCTFPLHSLFFFFLYSFSQCSCIFLSAHRVAIWEQVGSGGSAGAPPPKQASSLFLDKVPDLLS